MNVACRIRLAEVRAIGNEWFETYGTYSPMPPFHPPSLRNPQKVKQDWPQTGWKRTDTPEAKRQARQDMVEIMKRIRRQIGKPEVSQVAQRPVMPLPFLT